MGNMVERILRSYWLFWALLSLPFFWLVYDHFINHARGGKLFYWSGVYGVWLVLAALAITPLARMFRGAVWTRWLVQRRRHIGVAAFAYCALHVAYWLQRTPLVEILQSFVDPLVLFGWIGFFVYVAMAITSNDWSVRRMGGDWKRLQRWVYLATPLALLHWFMAEDFRWTTVIIYGGLLTVIMLLRLVVRRASARNA